MPSFPVAIANVTATNNGTNVVVTNAYKTVALAQTHGEQRGAVIRVFDFKIQNQGTVANITFADSSGSNLAGPFVVAANSNLEGYLSAPGFMFETTRSNSTFVGYDLLVTTNTTGPFQCAVTWTTSFVPGRVGA